MAEQLKEHERASAHGDRILVVDDYPLGRKLVAVRLRQAGFSVTTAITAEDALEIARRLPPDAILSDIRLTGMDGFALSEAVRSDPCLRHIPIVLLSSALGEPERQRARTLRVPCLVRTPDLADVIETLVAVLRDRSR
jgi:CheY-like chemotaxis protein